MLRLRTNGKIDLLAQDKMKAIARYPLEVLLAKDTYASFADAHEHSSVHPFIAARLADRGRRAGAARAYRRRDGLAAGHRVA